MLKYVYMVFLAILTAIFVGVSISVFYPQPEPPSYPAELTYANKEPITQQTEVQRVFDTKQRAWEERMKTYNRNVSIITLITAVVLVVVGTLLGNKLAVIPDGIVLGGVFTLLYSLGRGFAAQNSKYVFMVATISMIVALALGYTRFAKK